jgi:TPR repeat protein
MRAVFFAGRRSASQQMMLGFLFVLWSAANVVAQAGTISVPSPPFEKCMQIDPQMMVKRGEAGIAQGNFCVGFYYMEGKAGMPKDPARGVSYFRKAADEGYVSAYEYLGMFYKHGTGVQLDFPEAEKWYRKGAEAGDPVAQNDLAVLYMEGGVGVPRNKSEAERWAKLAAQQNFAPAFNTLNAIKSVDKAQRREPAQDLFDQGTRLYGAGNKAAAARPFLAAAQAGNSQAQLQIGWHYEYGVGVQQSPAEAAQWYRRSAEQGNSTAMKNLGTLYENGNGVSENWVEAAHWYQKSADSGNPYGEDSLAGAYEFGIGVPQSRRLAIQWYDRAASQNPHAAYYAKWLKEPTNNIGFRNADEHNLVIGGKLRYSGLLLGADPAGILFHNSAERLAWLSGQRRRVDLDEAATQWRIARQQYEQCQNAGGSNCRNPGPPPK